MGVDDFGARVGAAIPFSGSGWEGYQRSSPVRMERLAKAEQYAGGESPIDALARMGIQRDDAGGVHLSASSLQTVRNERLRRASVSRVPSTPRFVYRDAGGVGVRKGSGRFFVYSHETLRAIRERAPIIQAIHAARAAQVRRMAVRWSGRRGEVGWRVVHKDHFEHNATAPEFIKPYIERFQSMLESPAVRYNCRTTGSLLGPLEEDLLTINRPVVEKLYSAYDKKRVVGFRWVDGAMIWPTNLWLQKWMAENPQWYAGHDPSSLSEDDALDLISEIVRHDVTSADFCCVREGILEAVYTPGRLIVAPFINRTDVNLAGYWPSNVEQAIEIILTFINTWDYNATQFCVLDQLVTTEKGMERISGLVGEKFRIWNGRAWREATAYATGPKPVVRTKLWNGLELRSSQQHRFRVIPKDSETGEPEWVQQQHLKPGDIALLDTGISDPPMDVAAFRVGKHYPSAATHGREWTPTTAVVEDLDFWEMIGFALGDGYWPDLAKAAGHTQRMGIYPHHTKDAAIREKFIGVCARHGINADVVTVNKTFERVDGEHGSPVVHIHHKAFIEWLLELGFQPSCFERRVPDVLYRAPAAIRAALMRGYFSADGHRRQHITGYCTPSVDSQRPSFRQDILTCMWSLGVAVNEIGTGWTRDGTIVVQDVRAFVERIRYMQDYKNEDTTRSDRAAHRWDSLHPATSEWVATAFRESDAWADATAEDKAVVRKALQGRITISRPRALLLLQRAGIAAPEALHYHHVEIDVLDSDPVEAEPMYDVEVFDDEHLFLCNHIATHNTRGMMAEFILGISGNVHDDDIDAFVDMFREATQGVKRAWQPPIMPLPEGGTIEKIDLKPSNRDLMFDTFLALQAALSSAVYRMDPSTINARPWDGGGQPSLGAGTREKEISLAKEEGLQGDLQHLNEEILAPLAMSCHPDLRVVFEFGDFDPQKEAQIYEVRGRTSLTRNEIRLAEGNEPRGFWVEDDKVDGLSEEDRQKYDDNPWNWPTDPGFAQAIQQQKQADLQAQQAEQQGQYGQPGEPGADDGFGQPETGEGDGYGQPAQQAPYGQPPGPGGGAGGGMPPQPGVGGPGAPGAAPPGGLPMAKGQRRRTIRPPAAPPGNITVYVEDYRTRE